MPKCRRSPHGTCPLGLFARASMAETLDADEIFEITCAGLAHYEREFVVAYPFGKYDQVFVPEFNFGAMENPGVVTFREDAYLYRFRVTEATAACPCLGCPRFVEQIPELFTGRSPGEALDLARGLFPAIDPATVEAADELLAATDLPAGLRRVVSERRDDVQLALVCQEVSRRAI